ncbi:peptidoglycan DD-metalloendopeptidase family protein [Chromohalobacter sp. TMW 2.2308]|uniref:peptidoglycan DD-metalloendopeptidase family protein n=1 Tax=Chromohalobacter TaxID=42054 RepID=UPI001FFD6D65|nr:MULTISPECIES: peptidoglycan DD-metalloendopeptidase family protein [Chromohalobacter]MCK2042833.1 peptidoglycan DD-metalloendopeptidase family protein [Chromohalobacter moromii]MCT8514647.1 peptidoglycan DD-metalloendopeptidase family protein [Chromohalobacter sp. TMW 2.2271]
MSDARRLLPALGLVALGLAGCASSSGAPQVQDLSISRNSEPPSSYTVKSGDTLYGIAWQNNLDFRDLAQLNDITPPYRLDPGQTLRLTPEGEARAASSNASDETSGAVATPLGDGAESAGSAQDDDWLVPADSASSQGRDLDTASIDAQAVGAASDARESGAPGPVYDADDASDAPARDDEAESDTSNASTAGDASQETPSDSASTDDQATGKAPSEPTSEAGTSVAGESDATADRSQREYQPVDNVAWQWPTEGNVVNGFDDNSTVTAGIDIAGEKGQPVKAAGPGIVVYAGGGVRGYGNLIILKHNDHFLSAYAHNDTLRVEENDVVKAGEVIATMGDTDADRVKLHFEVRQDGQPQDPMEYLPSR